MRGFALTQTWRNELQIRALPFASFAGLLTS